MTTNANTNIPLSPEEAYLASRLFGKSLFSAIQLSKEMEERARRNEIGGGSNVLRIPIPINKLQKTSNEHEPAPGFIGRALRFNRNPIRALVGGETGFHEARREYFDSQRAQIQKELDDAQREYLETLQQIKQGEENTPNVDSFCNGLASEATIPELISKTAGNTAEDVNISDNTIRRLLGNTLSFAKKPVEPLIDLGATGMAGTAAGSAYLTYILKKKLREKDPNSYYQTDIPTRVELEPYE